MAKRRPGSDSAPIKHQPPAATGVEGLDHVLGAGLPRSRIYLVEGNPGAGKTTLGLQFMLEGVRQGEAVLFITSSETKEELQAVAASHGWSLEGVTIHELGSGEPGMMLDDQYTVFHPSEMELGETTKAVCDLVERVKPARVVFDSLSELRLLAREPLRYRRQIHALKQHFAARKCTVLLLDDRMTAKRDLRLESVASGVLRLEQLAPEYGAERRRLRVIKLRGVSYRGGYHDFSIETGGIVCFPRLIAAEHRHVGARGIVHSGIAELDQLFGGGLDRGTTTLLLGPAGVGKSIIATQYAVAAAERDERSAIYLFDEGIETFCVRAAGLNADVRPHVENGRIRIEQIDPAELSPGEFAHRVRQAVDVDGARLVIIDSLNGYLNAMPEERFLVAQLHELFTYVRQRNVLTISVVAQHGFVGGMETPVDVSYLADTVVLLRYFEAAGEVRQAISVMKKRSGVHERTIRELRLDAKGIRVGSPLVEVHGVLTGVPIYSGQEAPLLGKR